VLQTRHAQLSFHIDTGFCASYRLPVPETQDRTFATQTSRKVTPLAKNTGHGSRKGAVTHRTQVFNPETKDWTKRGPNGEFMDRKADDKPFKGVRKEK
jgi:hypothetical protein